MLKVLRKIFQILDDWFEEENSNRRAEGLLPLRRAQITLLGQMSLLANERVSALLHLVQTVDVDAHILMDNLVKSKLKAFLAEEGFVYDEDSHLIWIPNDSRYDLLFEFKHIVVKALDSESVLVSKAIKAPERNRFLIQEAISSEAFPNLIKRIEDNGGDLSFFGEES